MLEKSKVQWKGLWLLNQLYFLFSPRTIIQLGLSTSMAKLFVNFDIWYWYYQLSVAYSPCLIVNSAEFFVDDTVNVNIGKARKLLSQEQPYKSILFICRRWRKSLSLIDVEQHGSITMHIFFISPLRAWECQIKKESSIHVSHCPQNYRQANEYFIDLTWQWITHPKQVVCGLAKQN